jgi:double-stranded uracil-DNA glycosylase
MTRPRARRDETRGSARRLRPTRTRAELDPPPRRLPDIVAPGLRVLFVGINPGLRSAALGHHFAGHSNRFWTLLHESGLVPERLTFEEDRRLLEWGYGLTNLVGRPTAGLDDLAPAELGRGRRSFAAKVRRLHPRVIALVGLTVGRVVCEARSRGPITVGEAADQFAGARVFVLPNPSGRNAHYSHAQMLEAYAALARAIRDL